MADVRITQYPLKSIVSDNDIFLIADSNDVDVNGFLKYKKVRAKDLPSIVNAAESITYANLMASIAADDLIIGTFYKITDSTSGVSPLLVQAVGVDAIGYLAFDASNPLVTINYDVMTDTIRWSLNQTVAPISLGSLSATTPLSYNNTTGVFTISQSNTTTNGYLSSADWNTFNAKQNAGNYITALTGEATASGPVGGGSAAITLDNTAVIGKVLSGLNVTGGNVVSTDSILTAFGKTQNQINALVGGVMFQGVWDAATNNPALTSSVGTKGYYYVVNVAGSTNLNGITDWKVGDWAIFDGTAWQKVDNTDSVSSVFGRVGAVVAASGDYTTTQVTEGTNLYYTEARVNANTNVAANTAARHNAVTLGTANGLSLSTQQLSLGLASGSTTGALSSTDWTTFNNKQNALTNPITGTGTTNYLPKFTGTSALGNSIVSDNGTRVTIDGELRVALADANINLQGTSKSYLLQVVDSDNRFRIYDNTANAERFAITSAGNVGIGTTSPTQKLHLAIASASSLYTRIENANGNTYLGLNAGGDTILSADTAGNNLLLYTAATERMRITSAGNVGIGTTSPSYKFQTSASVNSDWVGSFYNTSTTTPNGLQVRVGVSSTAQALGVYTDGIGYTFNVLGNGNTLIGTTTDAGYKLDVNGTARVSGNLTATGNVSVGGTNQDSLLTINGSAGTSHARFREGSTTVGFIGGADGIISGQAGKLAIRGEAGLVLSGQGNSADVIISNTGAATFSSSVTVSSGGSTNGRLGVRGTTNDSSAYAFEAANSSGSTLFIVRNDGVASIDGKLLIGTFTPGGSPLKAVGLPTSASGLSAGDIWNDGGTLKIV